MLKYQVFIYILTYFSFSVLFFYAITLDNIGYWYVSLFSSLPI